MAGKVYTLMDGFRDARRILAVFSTREAAEAALHLGSERATIEAYDLDGPLPLAPTGHSLWYVQEFHGYSATRIDAFEHDGTDRVVFDGDSYRVDVWALNEDHALRVGAERIEAFKTSA